MEGLILYEIGKEDYLFRISQYEPNRKAASLFVSTLGWASQYSKNENIEEIVALEIQSIKRNINNLNETNSGSMKGLKWILKTLQEKNQLALFD